MDLGRIDADVANLLDTRAAPNVNGVAVDHVCDGAVVRLRWRRRRQDEQEKEEREPPAAAHHAVTVSLRADGCQQLGTAERAESAGVRATRRGTSRSRATAAACRRRADDAAPRH